jgi:hypothetical protein
MQADLDCRAETRQNFNGDSPPFVIEDLFGKKMDTRPTKSHRGKLYYCGYDGGGNGCMPLE